MIACSLEVSSTIYSGSVACMADLMVRVGEQCWANFRFFCEEGDTAMHVQCQGGLARGATGQDYSAVVFSQPYHDWDSDGLGAVLSQGLGLDPLSGFMLALDLQPEIQSYLANVRATVRKAVESQLNTVELEYFKAGLVTDTGALEASLNDVARRACGSDE